MGRSSTAGDQQGRQASPRSIGRRLKAQARRVSGGLRLVAVQDPQLAAVRASRAQRFAATKAGHAARRARETARLVDMLSDPDDPTPLEELWVRLTPRQGELVNE